MRCQVGAEPKKTILPSAPQIAHELHRALRPWLGQAVEAYLEINLKPIFGARGPPFLGGGWGAHIGDRQVWWLQV